MTTKRTSVDQDGKWRIGRPSSLLLLGGWSVAAALLYAIGDSMGARFLDMPLGALLAGQGALVGLLIVGVRVVSVDETDGR